MSSFHEAKRKGAKGGLFLDPTSKLCIDVNKIYWIYADPVCSWEVRAIYTSRMDLIRGSTMDPIIQDRPLEKGEIGPLTWMEALVEITANDTQRCYL